MKSPQNGPRQDKIPGFSSNPSTGMRVLRGTAVSPGYGEGTAFIFKRKEYLFSSAPDTTALADSATELRRLELARKAAQAELRALVGDLKKNYDLDEGQIFHTHFLMLEDDLFNGHIRDRIAKGRSAEAAIAEAMSELEQMFRRQVNPYLRERSIDIRDIGSRLLRQLMDRAHHPFANLPEAAVVVADELLPSDTIFLERGRVRAVVTAVGSENSHASILARAFGIPAVVGVEGILDACAHGSAIAVDGEAGRVILHIEGSERTDYSRRARGYRVAVKEIAGLSGGAVTLDGVEISLQANVDREEDIDVAVERGASGIGLLRTEIIYLAEGGEASEERQEEIYRYAAQRMRDRPVNIRILDVASDKALALGGDSAFAGAATTDSGVHYALAHPNLLRPQLRAILRAADEGNLRVLLPGVTGVTEILAFRRLLEQVAEDLGRRGPKPRIVDVGAMIETPSALFMLEDIAENTQFLSLGTNDLLRYLFGRMRRDVKETVFEPSLLRVIRRAVTDADARRLEIGICGEVAGRPDFSSLLVGLGLRRLSMSPERLPEVRYSVSRIRATESAALAQKAIRQQTCDEVQRLLSEHEDPWHELLRRRTDEEE